MPPAPAPEEIACCVSSLFAHSKSPFWGGCAFAVVIIVKMDTTSRLMMDKCVTAADVNANRVIAVLLYCAAVSFEKQDLLD
jgi:hypothetical protein